jgi:hypothetical protein
MRAVLKLEFIGENYFSYKRQSNQKNEAIERYGEFLGRDKSRPWVARILGFSEEERPIREFVRGQIDYSQASKNGSRGVFLYYPLKDGIYEINDRQSWQSVLRYFVHVENSGITKITKEAAIQCLAKLV